LPPVRQTLIQTNKAGDIDYSATLAQLPKCRKVFDSMGREYLLYIILMYDYNSKFRLRPIEKKQEDCIKELGLNKKKLSSSLLSEAIAEYKVTQYDEFYESFIVDRNKLEELNKVISETALNTENSENMIKLMLSKEKLRACIKKQEEELIKLEGVDKAEMKKGVEKSDREIMFEMFDI
jgi:hypothetical protein